MSAPMTAEQLIGRTAVDNDGDKIGKIGQVYLNDETNQPEWLAVSTGLFGTHESFAPISGASMTDDNVRLAVSKELVKSAPHIAEDGHLDDAETDELYRHYASHLSGYSSGYTDTDTNVGTTNVGRTEGYTDTNVGTTDYDTGTVGHDTSGPNTDDAMTRSEERVRVGTRNVEVGRARLRKYIVTENVTQTVPVSHEEVHIEREPITEANRGQAYSGADLSEEEHEVVLHAQEPVVTKETVPVERVRLDTEVVTGQETITEQVRKEQVEVENEPLQGGTTRRN